MVALQPAFLACHTSALRAHAQQLAFLLSTAGTSAAPTASGSLRYKNARIRASSAAQGRLAFPPGKAPHPRAQPPAATPAAPAIAPGRLAAAAAGPPPNGDARAGGPPAAQASGPAPAAVVTPQAVLVLLARQPALLQLPPQLLASRCGELAAVLGATPYDACLALTRMRPEEAARILQAPPKVVRQSWQGLLTALASLDQPGLYGHQMPPASDLSEAAALRSEDSGDGYELCDAVVRKAGGGKAGRAGAVARKGTQSPATAGASYLPRGVKETARRAVLLCPQLLLLPPGGVRASAVHLRDVLGLTPAGLRRLLARSPRLLLLPRQHRVAALASLTSQLALRRPGDAARLVTQQPNLLKWTPAGLAAKLAEMGAALGLPRHGVARLCRNSPALLAMSSGSLAAKLRGLQALLGLPDAAAARRLALRQPGLLSLSSATLERKVRLLAFGLGLTTAFVAAAAAPAATAEAEASRRSRARRDRAVTRTVLRLVAEEPTLLTLSLATLPRRMAALAEALGGAPLHETRRAVLACPRLLIVQRGALEHRLGELAFGLEAPPTAVRRLVLARPRALFVPLPELRAAVARAQVAGAGRGLRGARLRVTAALHVLAAGGLAEGWEEGPGENDFGVAMAVGDEEEGV